VTGFVPPPNAEAKLEIADAVCWLICELSCWTKIGVCAESCVADIPDCNRELACCVSCVPAKTSVLSRIACRLWACVSTFAKRRATPVPLPVWVSAINLSIYQALRSRRRLRLGGLAVPDISDVAAKADE
jgi:hypothetical protein